MCVCNHILLSAFLVCITYGHTTISALAPFEYKRVSRMYCICPRLLYLFCIRHVAKKVGIEGSTQKHRGRKDFFIYLKMFSILSFNWIFGILTLIIPDDNDDWGFMPWMTLLQVSSQCLQAYYLPKNLEKC